MVRTSIVATLFLVTAVTQAFSLSPTTTRSFTQNSSTRRSVSSLRQHSNNNVAFLSIRGGQQDEEQVEEVDSTPITVTITEEEQEEPVQVQEVVSSDSTTTLKAAGPLSAMTSTLASVGALYANALTKSPILTKSVTAGCIFAVSDYLAQRFEASSKTEKDKKVQLRLNFTRILTSAAVGLLYFGPAAHYWYDMIFRFLPGTSLVSILQKAAMGQMFFGPSFTCIFFATSLLQSGNFSLGNWVRKIRQDLPGAWLAGVGFWPLVDLVSFSLIPQQWIPLFVNMCSLVWTIYLSTVANRS